MTNKPKKLLIFPFGGNGRDSLCSIFAINSISKEWDILGFIDDNNEVVGRVCCGISVIGGREILYQIPESYILAVPGNSLDHIKRAGIIDGLNIDKDRFITIIHPNVVKASDAHIGYNNLIMANTVIGSNVKIGNHCIMLPNSVVGHDSVIGDYSCVGANVSISGSVVIGEAAYIGSGSSIKDNLSIGAGSLIGIGSNVIRDVSSLQIVAGNPAMPIKPVKPVNILRRG